ncbi:hypothetical protein ACFL0D_09175 [Thermoproteota archaeon]
MGFIGDQENQGYSPRYIGNYLKAVRSWANWCGIRLVRTKISNSNHTPTLIDEQVPTIDQVSEIRSNASSRGRICVGVIAYGGQRPEVLGHQRIEDGLRLRDFPELDIENLEFKKVPALVVIRAEISKAGHTYRTFLPEPTCRDIEVYLKTRRAKGEELDLESPLVAVTSSHIAKGQRTRNGRVSRHLVTAIISRDIRKAMRPRFDYRPYVLRSFFSTRLLLAVSEGVLDNNYRIYWMGHTGNMSARYSTNKAMLPDDLIESMRLAYQRATPYLVGGGTDEDALRRKMLLDAARLYGLPDNQVQQIEQILDDASSVDDAIREITRSGIAILPSRETQKQIKNGYGLSHGDYVFVNSNEQLAKYLKEGYEFVREVSSESSEESIDDETWIMPNGRTLSDGEKVYAVVKEDGSIEMRGNPNQLNSIEEELLELGVSLDKIDSGPRYLLRKKKS